MKKKLLTILIMSAMLVTLVGCGEKEKTSTPKNTETVETETKSETQGEKVEDTTIIENEWVEDSMTVSALAGWSLEYEGESKTFDFGKILKSNDVTIDPNGVASADYVITISQDYFKTNIENATGRKSKYQNEIINNMNFFDDNDFTLLLYAPANMSYHSHYVANGTGTLVIYFIDDTNEHQMIVTIGAQLERESDMDGDDYPLGTIKCYSNNEVYDISSNFEKYHLEQWIDDSVPTDKFDDTTSRVYHGIIPTDLGFGYGWTHFLTHKQNTVTIDDVNYNVVVFASQTLLTPTNNEDECPSDKDDPYKENRDVTAFYVCGFDY